MMRNSKTDEPEELLEPLPGRPSYSCTLGIHIDVVHDDCQARWCHIVIVNSH